MLAAVEITFGNLKADFILLQILRVVLVHSDASCVGASKKGRICNGSEFFQC